MCADGNLEYTMLNIYLYKKAFEINYKIRARVTKNYVIRLFKMGAGQNGTATKWHGHQIATEGHFGTVCHYGTEGHFGTATKCLSFNFVLF